jgi:hypothetical protein
MSAINILKRCRHVDESRLVEFQCNFVQARQVITSYSFSGTSGSSSGINVAGQVKTTGGIVKI